MIERHFFLEKYKLTKWKITQLMNMYSYDIQAWIYHPKNKSFSLLREGT